jgi:hypothetical protein
MAEVRLTGSAGPGGGSFSGPRVDLAAVRSAGSGSRTLPGPGGSRRTQSASKTGQDDHLAQRRCGWTTPGRPSDLPHRRPDTRDVRQPGEAHFRHRPRPAQKARPAQKESARSQGLGRARVPYLTHRPTTDSVAEERQAGSVVAGPCLVQRAECRGPRAGLAPIRSAGSGSRTLPGPGGSRRTQPAFKKPAKMITQPSDVAVNPPPTQSGHRPQPAQKESARSQGLRRAREPHLSHLPAADSTAEAR